MTTAPLTDALAAAKVDERCRALRALLRSPLLAATGRDAPAFTLVRRHAAWLRELLARETGWHLDVEAEFARLRKVPADHGDATRGAIARPSGQPFSRRRYVLLCLALATLERAEQQVTLGRLAEQVVAGAADPDLVRAGISFDLDTRDQRSDLVAVVRLLLDQRVLVRVAGDEQGFLAATGDALYDIDRRLLAAVLATRRGPSTVAATDLDERIEAITGELVADTDEARARAHRHALSRRLLDDPVVYEADLTDDQRAYWQRQRTPLARRLADATGFVPEHRAEGTALLDPSGEATDARMPEEGTDGHATLLLAEHLAATGEPASLTDIVDLMAELAQRYRSYWRRAAGEPGGARELASIAVGRLVALGLARVDGDHVLALPALARYRAGQASVTRPGGHRETIQESLL
jgi:uncharacterized protein (TIGR02678 family)